MQKYSVIYLERFKGGLHLARGLSNAYDKSLDVLHSDTLKSAIFAMAIQLYPELGDSDNHFEKGREFLSAFKISSAFPFYQIVEGQRLHFFPKPELPYLRFSMDGDFEGKEKQLKKIRYLEQGLFEAVLHKASDVVALRSKNVKGNYASAPDLDLVMTLKAGNCDEITRSEPYQHVEVPVEPGGDSIPYTVDKIFFHQDAGLFFLLEAEEEEIKDKVKSAMYLLQDSGIGTDRNTGNGQFEVAFGELSMNLPEQGDFDLSLSLYCPREEEIQNLLSESFYGLTKRGGYISSPASLEHLTIRKKSIYMFTEGSVFPTLSATSREGKLVDLKPAFGTLQHPIWRDGRPVFVPMVK